MQKTSKFAWLRLNADGVLIAILGLSSGFDLFRPKLSDLAVELGYIPPTFMLWSTLFFVGGLLMLWGFAEKSIGLELAGRFGIGLGAIIQVTRFWTAFGPGDDDTLRSVFIVSAVLICFYFRVTTLLSKEGVAVFIPPRGSGRGGKK